MYAAKDGRCRALTFNGLEIRVDTSTRMELQEPRGVIAPDHARICRCGILPPRIGSYVYGTRTAKFKCCVRGLYPTHGTVHVMPNAYHRAVGSLLKASQNDVDHL